MSGGPSPIAPHRDGVTIDLHVQPRASGSEVIGVREGTLRVRVTAPPVDGAANAAVIELLAKQLDVRRSDIQIISGDRGRSKRVLIHALNAEDVCERLRLNESDPKALRGSLPPPEHDPSQRRQRAGRRRQ